MLLFELDMVTEYWTRCLSTTNRFGTFFSRNGSLTFLLFFFISLALPQPAYATDGESFFGPDFISYPPSGTDSVAFKIMDKVNQNRFYESVYYEGRMIIRNGRQSVHKSFLFWVDGNERAVMVVTDPKNMKERYVMQNGHVVHYLPNGNDVALKNEHLVGGGLMGSTFSYLDFVQGCVPFEDKYTPFLIGKRRKSNEYFYIILLIAKNEKPLFPERVVWVDEKYVIRKMEYYDAERKLAKQLISGQVVATHNRYIPMALRMQDGRQPGMVTEIDIEHITTNAVLPRRFFK